MIFLLLCGIVQAQVQERESNNSFQTADTLNEASVKKGDVSLSDQRDYFSTKLAADGTVKIIVSATNTGAANGYLRLYFYDKSGRELLNRVIANRTDVSAGATVHDTVNIYSRGADSMYFLLYADNQPFGYTLRYDIASKSPNDKEPNNNFAQAIKFNEAAVQKGHVGYTADGAYDSHDYYKTTLAEDGTVKIAVSGVNTGGSNGYLRLYVFDKSGRELLNRVVNNKTDVAPGQTVSDTVNIYSRGADTMYFLLYADNQSFSYNLQYSLIDKSTNDREPNNSTAEATTFSESDVNEGHIGYTTNGVYDARDYYQSAITADGNLRVNISGTNTGGSSGYLRLYVYDKSGRELVNRVIGNTTNVAHLATVSEIINVPSRSGETFYFLVYADNRSFSYNFSYSLTGITQSDKEPNNTFGEAGVFNETDTLTGNIGYTSNGVYDSRDYYKTGLSADGTVKIIVDGKNTGAANGYLRLYFFDKSGRELLNRVLNNKTDVAAGAAVYDTLHIYSRGADSMYFLVYADNQSFNYHLRYELTTQSPVDAEPNNTMAQATLFNEGDVLLGHSGYTTDGVYDFRDYYRSLLPDDGTMKISVAGTNTGGSNGYLRLYVFDKSGRELLNRVLNNKTDVAPGATVYDTISIFSRGMDTMYFQVYSDNQSFSYSLQYQLIDRSENDNGINDAFAQAALFNEKTVLKGHIGYTTNGVYDSRDYYKTLLPADGTFHLRLAGTNTGGSNGYLRVYVFDKSGRELLNRVVANKTDVAPAQTVYDTLNIYSRDADTLYLLMYADNQSFSYNASYVLNDQSPNDREPNNTFEEAFAFGRKDTLYGHIGYTVNGNYDSHDYYRMGISESGTVKFFVQAKNTGGSNGYLRMYVFNYSRGELLNKVLLNRTDVKPGETINDTLLFNCMPKDSLYILVYADNQSFSYSMQQQVIGRQPKAAFEYVRTGNTFGFSNSSARADSYLWDMANGSTNTNRYAPLTTYGPGYYEVKLVAYNNTVAGCSFTDTAKAGFTVKGLEKYTPLKGGQGNVVFNVYGGGLDKSLRVTLTRGGKVYTDSASGVSPYANIYGSIFNLHDAEPGAYDVDIVTKDSSYHYPGGFTLEGRRDKLRIELIGRQSVRNNTDYLYTVRVHNDGNVNAGITEVYMLSSDWIEVTRLDSIVYPVTTPGVSPDTLPEVIHTSIKGGYPTDGYLRGFFVSNIPNGGYRDLNFKIRFLPHNQVGQMHVWVNGPFSGSPMFDWVTDCWKARIRRGYTYGNILLNKIPVVDCGWNVLKTLSLPITSTIWGISNGWDVAAFMGSTVKSFAGLVKNCGPEALAATGVLAPLAVELEAVEWMTDIPLDGYDIVQMEQYAYEKCPDGKDKDRKKPDAGGSMDPNAKVGPTGYGSKRYINGNEKLINYNIFFENVDTATAAAQVVTIIDTLDKKLFDLSSFKINSFGVGLRSFSLPLDRKEFVTDVNISNDLAVRPIIKLDTATGILRAVFTTIDRKTGDVPDNPLTGFLPPNKTAPEGDGYLNYSVNLKDGLADGTTISNKATIIFDNNEPIATDAWVNILDNRNPSSSIDDARLANDTTIVIKVKGNDAASGVEHYKLYASRDGGDYLEIGEIRDSVTFKAAPSTTYNFYVVAVDSVGNVEAKAAQSEATLTTGKTLPVNMLPLAGVNEGKVNRLNWSTVMENNNKGFYIEKSTDGRQFTQDGFVASKAVNGNSQQAITYEYADAKPLERTWYRLKQVDKDGRFAYSNVVVLTRASASNAVLKVYPNPARGFVHIQHSARVNSITVTDITGKWVAQFPVNMSGNYNISALKSGIYFFEITSPAEKQTVKLVVY